MIQMLNKRRNRAEDSGEEGFTLIELMVVVLIIGILLAIAVPTFLKAQDNAKSKAAQSNVRSALSAAKTVYADTQSYETTGTPPAIDASVLRSAEPSLQWNPTTSTSPEIIGFTSNGATELLLAVKSKNNDCFYIKDNVGTASGTAGTFYGRKNGVGTSACTAATTLTTPTNDYVRDAKEGWK